MPADRSVASAPTAVNSSSPTLNIPTSFEAARQGVGARRVETSSATTIGFADVGIPGALGIGPPAHAGRPRRSAGEAISCPSGRQGLGDLHRRGRVPPASPCPPGPPMPRRGGTRPRPPRGDATHARPAARAAPGRPGRRPRAPRACLAPTALRSVSRASVVRVPVLMASRDAVDQRPRRVLQPGRRSARPRPAPGTGPAVDEHRQGTGASPRRRLVDPIQAGDEGLSQPRSSSVAPR